MNQLLAVGLGGAVGSVLRYLLSNWTHAFAGREFPYATLLVNVLGCLAMGFLFVLFTGRLSESTVLRVGILVGVLGGFTTFSAFSIETFVLLEQGQISRALLNILSSVGLCIIATWGGVVLARTTVN